MGGWLFLAGLSQSSPTLEGTPGQHCRQLQLFILVFRRTWHRLSCKALYWKQIDKKRHSDQKHCVVNKRKTIRIKVTAERTGLPICKVRYLSLGRQTNTSWITYFAESLQIAFPVAFPVLFHLCLPLRGSRTGLLSSCCPLSLEEDVSLQSSPLPVYLVSVLFGFPGRS